MPIEVGLQCKESVENIQEIQDQLYNTVINGGFDNALKLTETLHKSGHLNAINTTISRLLNNGTPNIMGYAYRLWLCNYRDLIYGNFPPALNLILNGDPVTITNKQYDLPMKLQIDVDNDGDRKAWGDGAKNVNDRMKWKFITIWENNTMYCKIQNVEYHMFLKLVFKTDNVGDREVFGAVDDDTDRHQWYLRPVMNEGTLLFYIINRKYGQALKMGAWQDKINDRIVWGHNGEFQGQPGTYGWSIEQN